MTAGADFTFTTPTAVVLQPSTTYWLVGYSLTLGSSNQIEWDQSTPKVTPTGIATSNGLRFNTPAVVPPTNVDLVDGPVFQVNGTLQGSGTNATAAPALSAVGLGVCAAVLLMAGALATMRASRERARL